MQGFAFKTLFFVVALLTFSSSMAATTSISKLTINRISLDANSAAAGCMGCHQGETTVMTIDETDNQKQSSEEVQK